VDGKYSINCYLEALEGAYSHLCSNLGIEKGKLLEKLDYLVYHMPFSNMAKKAHRHLIDLEYDGVGAAAKERLFAETFSQKVEPGLLGSGR
jgi:hydroxymethylglutaryl-CoA synthase